MAPVRMRGAEQAVRDLEEIHDYIARTSPRYAAVLTGRLVAAADQVREYPESGRVVPELGGPGYDVREHQWRAAFEDAAAWFGCVAEPADGQLVGFASGTLHDGGVPGFEGELNKIYVLREWYRHGIGRRLVEWVARRFLERGITSMLLFGDASSPSNGFYERLGAERLHSPEGRFHGGHGWRDLRQLVRAHATR